MKETILHAVIKNKERIRWIGKIWSVTAVCTLIISIIMTFQDLDLRITAKAFLKLFGYMNIGFLIHVTLLIVFIRCHFFPEAKSIRGLIGFYVAGAITTFVVVLFIKPLSFQYTSTVFSLLIYIFSVCLIIQIFMYATDVYDFAIEEQKRIRPNKLLNGANKEQPQYILVKISKEEMEQIWVEDL